MSLTNNIELLIITVVVSVLFIIITILVIEALVVVIRVKQIVNKSAKLITDVESAAEVLKHASKASKSRFPLLSLISSIANSHKKDK